MDKESLPRNLDAEKALLSSILIDPSVLYRVKRHIKPDDGPPPRVWGKLAHG